MTSEADAALLANGGKGDFDGATVFLTSRSKLIVCCETMIRSN